jgi:hypothetical protein
MFGAGDAEVRRENEESFEGAGELDEVSGINALQARPIRPSLLAKRWERHCSQQNIFIVSEPYAENDHQVNGHHENDIPDNGPGLYGPANSTLDVLQDDLTPPPCRRAASNGFLSNTM